MQNLFSVLDGKKTYVMAVVTAVYQLLVATNAISAKHQAQITVILASGIVAALRSALSKLAAVK